MNRAQLERFADRVDAIYSTNPPVTRAERRDWIARPLLSVLGWSADGGRVDDDRTVGSIEVDHMLSVDVDGWTPAGFVVVAPPNRSADRIQGTLGSVMADTGVDRAIYVTDAGFVFVGGPDAIDRRTVPFDSLTDHSEVLSRFTPDAIGSHVETLPARSRAARRLAVYRKSVTEAIDAAIADSTGLDPNALQPVLDDVIDTVLDGQPSQPDVDSSHDDGSAGTRPLDPDTDRPSSEEPSRPGNGPNEDGNAARSVASPESQPDATQPTTASVPSSQLPETDREGEFVVRVFNERGSIGAVGHSTSAGALREAATYFFERGLTGVRTPWGIDDGPLVLNDRPVDRDGDRWSAYEQLPNGVFLNTSGSVEDRAERVEALATRATLRVMLTGDW